MKLNEAEEIKLIFKRGLARRISLDLKRNKNVKGGILDGFDGALGKSSLGGTKQHVEVLEWAASLLDYIADEENLIKFMTLSMQSRFVCEPDGVRDES